MKISTACKIFLQVNSDKYTDEEKGMAIYEVLKMPTHNGITKDAMLKVIEYLLNLAFDIPEENEAEQNDKKTKKPTNTMPFATAVMNMAVLSKE